MSGYITTATGKQFSFEQPTPDMICLDDIAHALSLLCHWNGHCRTFFSVAQHSVLVSLIVPPQLRRWALFHDAAEAYCGDVTRPLKALLPDYKILERRVLKLIAYSFSLSWPEPIELKQYDNQILRLESRLLMPPSEVLHDGRGNPIVIPELTSVQRSAIGVASLPLKPVDAEKLFLTRYDELFFCRQITIQP